MGSTSKRLTLLFTAISGILLAVFGASLYAWVRQGLESSLDRDVAIQSALFQDRWLAGREDLERFLETADALAEVRRSDGTVLFRSPGYSDPQPGYRETATRLDGSPGGLRFRFALRDDEVQKPLRQLRLYFAFFYPLALLVSSVVGFFFARRALRPVEELRRHAEQITRANLSGRVPLPAVRGELRDLATTFNEMLDRLESALEDLRHLAADAAHELRTPLAVLRAEIETAIQEPRSLDEHERVLMSVAEEVARMSRIVADLFTLAQLDRRQHALERRRVDLRPILEEARETWAPAAGERRIEISLEGVDAPIQGDPSALHRVFMNLVENAVKYNRDGGRVLLSIERRDGSALVRVTDTGPGIAAEHLPKLFRRFYRADPARSRENGGAGLGLAIVKSFVEALGGTIEVRSAVTEGTTFTLQFPTLADAPQQA